MGEISTDRILGHLYDDCISKIVTFCISIGNIERNIGQFVLALVFNWCVVSNSLQSMTVLWLLY